MSMEVEIKDAGVADAVRSLVQDFYYYCPDLRKPRGLAKFLDREAVHSHELNATLAALPRRVLAQTLATLLGHQQAPSNAYPVTVRFRKDGKWHTEQLCEPDFAIAYGDCLVLGEVKAFPKTRNARTPYPPTQLLNYLSFVEKVRVARVHGSLQPTRFAHLIVLPSIDRRWFKRGKEWVTLKEQLDADNTRIDAHACYSLSKAEKPQKHIKTIADLKGTLARVPVICRTWADVTEAANKAAQHSNDEDSLRLAAELRRIASRATAGLLATGVAHGS